MTFPPPSLKPILEQIIIQLKDRHETVSIAETVSVFQTLIEQRHFFFKKTDTDTQAAGGIISAAILSCPGASAIYRGGLTVGSFIHSL